MDSFVIGDMVLITDKTCARIYGMTGFVLSIKEQEPSNFYTIGIKLNGKDMEFGVFQHEMRKITF